MVHPLAKAKFPSHNHLPTSSKKTYSVMTIQEEQEEVHNKEKN